MFVNVNKILAKLKELGMTVTEVSARMEINRSTLYRKLDNKGSGLTVKDAQLMIEILGLTEREALDIFFARTVA